uniref:Uncharacterized protein LOC102807379 n=1 Tax=Saccoglossus kowalevskii TaxID=10224 RepID=A0ABM0LYU9_SACKO|nr:PREDICTED: uncharacterized protein LOC102807379 [Saccoglossus kowalevskii]
MVRSTNTTYRRTLSARDNSTSSEEQNSTDIPEETEQKEFKTLANASYFLLISIVVVVVVLLVVTFPDPEEWRPFDITGEEEVIREKFDSWRRGDRETELLLNSSICNIDKRFSNELTNEEFATVYRYKKPVIIVFQHGANEWTSPEDWTLENLLWNYQDWEIASGTSYDIVRHGGSGNEFTTFNVFLNTLMDQQNPLDEPIYVFDRFFYKDTSLPATIKVPEYLAVTDETDDSIFFLGASKSGVSFHKHADAWNGVVYGRKRWFLYPPQKTPPGGVWPGFSSLDWFNEVYPHLEGEEKPIECIQEAGEILSQPESFYHSTLNIGDTVAIGIQKKQAATEIETLFYEAKELEKVNLRNDIPKEEKRHHLMRYRQYFEKLHHLLPENSEVLNLLGFAIFTETQDTVRAMKVTKEAMARDAYFVEAILNMAKYHFFIGEHEQALQLYKQAREVNPKNWGIYAQYGDALAQLNHPQKAAELYHIGTQLKPAMIPFWVRLADQQEKMGDLEGAEKSRREVMRLQQDI